MRTFKPEVDTEGFQWVRNERGPEQLRAPVSRVVLERAQAASRLSHDQPLGPAHAGLDAPGRRTWCSRTARLRVGVRRVADDSDPCPRAQIAGATARGLFGFFDRGRMAPRSSWWARCPPATVQFIANSLKAHPPKVERSVNSAAAPL